MEPQSESIEELLRVIVNFKETDRQDELEEHLGALFDILFAGGGLQTLASEKTINQLDTVMTTHGIWEKYTQEKEALDEQKLTVHDIHSNLYSVLDLRVDIDTLLCSRLDSWPTSAKKFEVDFSQGEKEELQAIREEAESTLSTILDTFFRRYFDLLNEKGIDVSEIRQLVIVACKEYERLEQRTDCLALFVEQNLGVVSSIQLKWTSGDSKVTSPTDVGPEMKQAARIAIQHTLQILGLRDQYHINWMIEHPRVYEGTSVGLPLSVALLKKLTPIKVDCYTVFTGEIDFQSDSVKKVGCIKEKLVGAVSFGLRRVFLPKENEDEARSISLPNLEVVPVGSISETRTKLIAFSTPMKVTQAGPSVETQLKAFEIKCKGKGLLVTPGKDIGTYGRQLVISNFLYEIPVNVYFGRKGLHWLVGGNKELDLHHLAQQLCSEAFGPVTLEGGSPRQDFFKWVVKDMSLRSTVKRQLRSLTGWKEESEKNCEYRLNFQKGGEAVRVRQFSNGTLTVTGIPAGTQLFFEICRLIELALGISPGSSGTVRETKDARSIHYDTQISGLGNKTRVIPSYVSSWIGTDESGKGDYFGPLVSAGVWVDKEIEKQLMALGVKDSKKLSDLSTRELAKKIRAICAGRYAEVPIPPQTYNNLYNQFKRERKTLNTLLAWGHARAIEDILGKVHCEYALADQFADERFIVSKLQEAGRKVTLIQRSKAEEDIAVAAASILARDRFLFYLDKMSHEYDLGFPKGASAEVIRVAKEFIARYGKDQLGKVAKLHFRTTKEVLG